MTSTSPGGALDTEAVDRLVRSGTAPCSPLDQRVLRRLGGAMNDVDPAATAFAIRDADYLLLLAGTWEDPTADPEPHRSWVRRAWADVRPWAHGTYVTHLGNEGADRIREAYPEGT